MWACFQHRCIIPFIVLPNLQNNLRVDACTGLKVIDLIAFTKGGKQEFSAAWGERQL
jgi:hypothetical protein